jgi:hypothetical protein
MINNNDQPIHGGRHMAFPSRPLVRDALLSFIFYNGGQHYEVHSDHAYQALADYFDLSVSDREMTRSEKYGDNRSDPAWNNIVQFARRDLADRGYIDTNTLRNIWKLSQQGVVAAQQVSNAYSSLIMTTPKSVDFSPPSPASRIKVEEYRILRDTSLARYIKVLHNSSCQICGLAVPLSNNQFYAEAHHIQPLGTPHNGPDIEGNILIVCPVHHVQCDYGAINLDISTLRTIPEHKITQVYIDYHNDKISKQK